MVTGCFFEPTWMLLFILFLLFICYWSCLCLYLMCFPPFVSFQVMRVCQLFSLTCRPCKSVRLTQNLFVWHIAMLTKKSQDRVQSDKLYSLVWCWLVPTFLGVCVLGCPGVTAGQLSSTPKWCYCINVNLSLLDRGKLSHFNVFMSFGTFVIACSCECAWSGLSSSF